VVASTHDLHRPFQEFFRTEAAGGALLVACAGAALLIANSRWASGYFALLATPVTIGAAGQTFSLTIQHWINDGLMAVFFLLIGLEIKREILAGELASVRHAALPIAAAFGGMVVPALIYVLTNPTGLASRGWAIPMATDIAFALGALAIAAPRAPNGLKVFLTALAIVDDLGAIVVIAVFYSGDVAWSALAQAGLVAVLLLVLNLLRVRRLFAYLALGVLLWILLHASGVHATIAGVLLAFAIPTRTRINAPVFSRTARDLLDEFDRTETGDFLVLTSKGQQDAITGLERASESVTPPLLTLEHTLHGFSAFVVMPLFALCNAGVTLTGLALDRVALGVILGLAVGKPVGISLAAMSAVRFRVAERPRGVSPTALHGCAWLGGIGFTMSLFIATLAFEGTGLLESAKVGILAASTMAGVVGAVILQRGIQPQPRPERR
jgi:NhaA family Na+:H+ antiporter